MGQVSSILAKEDGDVVKVRLAGTTVTVWIGFVGDDVAILDGVGEDFGVLYGDRAERAIEDATDGAEPDYMNYRKKG